MFSPSHWWFCYCLLKMYCGFNGPGGARGPAAAGRAARHDCLRPRARAWRGPHGSSGRAGPGAPSPQLRRPRAPSAGHAPSSSCGSLGGRTRPGRGCRRRAGGAGAGGRERAGGAPRSTAGRRRRGPAPAEAQPRRQSRAPGRPGHGLLPGRAQGPGRLAAAQAGRCREPSGPARGLRTLPPAPPSGARVGPASSLGSSPGGAPRGRPAVPPAPG